LLDALPERGRIQHGARDACDGVGHLNPRAMIRLPRRGWQHALGCHAVQLAQTTLPHARNDLAWWNLGKHARRTREPTEQVTDVRAILPAESPRGQSAALGRAHREVGAGDHCSRDERRIAATSSRNPNVARAQRSQLYARERSWARTPRVKRKLASSARRRMAAAMSSRSSGSKYTPASPRISGMGPRRAQAIGRPLDMEIGR